MPNAYRPRAEACTRCGDTVLIVEQSIGAIFGKALGRKPRVWLEHADPSPDGDVFDGVDADCRRDRPTA